MTVIEIAPDVDRAALLAGAQFVDAYRIAVEGGALDARRAAERMITRQPRWAEALLTLRHILVKPFGLKTSGAGGTAPGDLQPRRPVGRLRRNGCLAVGCRCAPAPAKDLVAWPGSNGPPAC